ncbi:MAG TPA: GIY-YIG nuclease family protein [Gemmataceae bacterium]|nr:GIY-YIG nuclease family protein [Gemmataceae bacterium]
MTKTHILAEIQRTADANGGEALGLRRFETETGIRRTDWSRFWARWGGAIREAGLEPKEFTAAYENSTLLDFYVKLAREMGRLPAWSDLKLKAYNDADCPSDKVFRRFGSKEGLLRQLVEHCRGKEGHEDVLRLCEGYVPRRKDALEEDEPPEAAAGEEIGFIYLMKSGRFYKIGRSNSAGRREYELGIQLPELVMTVHVIRTDDPVGIEGYWHKRFEAKQKNGEWFELDARDLAAFKRRKFM